MKSIRYTIREMRHGSWYVSATFCWFGIPYWYHSDISYEGHCPESSEEAVDATNLHYNKYSRSLKLMQIERVIDG